MAGGEIGPFDEAGGAVAVADHEAVGPRLQRLSDGKIILVDEIVTPDSSRFWPTDKPFAWKPQAV